MRRKMKQEQMNDISQHLEEFFEEITKLSGNGNIIADAIIQNIDKVLLTLIAGGTIVYAGNRIMESLRNYKQ